MKTALIIVDVQKGTLEMPLLVPGNSIVEQNANLATRFRAHKLPVIIALVDGIAPGRTAMLNGGSGKDISIPDDYADYAPGLLPEADDVVVRKQGWDAFIGTNLHEQLQAHGVGRVVVTGIVTSLGVESTARSAYGLGYDVVLATDAMTDTDEPAQEHSLRWVFPRLGQLEGSIGVAAMLEK